MKVLFIAPFKLEIHDGTTIRVLNLAKAATYISEEVFLVSPSINEEFKLNNIVNIKMKEIEGRYHFTLAYLSEFSSKLSFTIGTRILHINPEEYDFLDHINVIHVHWLLYKYLAKILQQIVHKRIPLVVDLHGSWNLQQSKKGYVKDVLALKLGQAHEALAFRDNSIDAFTSPSISFNNYIASKYKVDPKKLFEVKDAVDAEVIASSRSCNEIEVNKLIGEISSSTNLIAYTGSTTNFHGFLDLIEAYNILKKFYKYNFKLLLIVPSITQSLMINRDTIILKNIPRRFVPCVLRKATVLVFPHIAGTQFDYIPSNKIYDYILAGRPIVAYKTSAADDLLKDYSMYIPVKPNNPIELARGIIKAVETYGNSEPKPMYNKVPTINSVAESLKRVYSEIV
ncbi:MAG: glycosyltransferase, partial [Infirmifilum sp.]